MFDCRANISFGIKTQVVALRESRGCEAGTEERHWSSAQSRSLESELDKKHHDQGSNFPRVAAGGQRLFHER